MKYLSLIVIFAFFCATNLKAQDVDTPATTVKDLLEIYDKVEKGEVSLLELAQQELFANVDVAPDDQIMRWILMPEEAAKLLVLRVVVSTAEAEKQTEKTIAAIMSMKSTFKEVENTDCDTSCVKEKLKKARGSAQSFLE